MSPGLALVALGTGLFLLYFSGEKLISFASALAEKSGISPAVVGLTVVAAGTSAPELFVSVLAAVDGRPDIAAGNVIGSNIVNLTLVLGATALTGAIKVERRILKIDYPFLLLSSWIVLLLCRDGLFDRLEGGFAAVAATAFMAWSVVGAGGAVEAKEKREIAGIVPSEVVTLRERGYATLGAGMTAAIVGLSFGSRLLISGAVGIATRFGLTDRIVGLSIVAVGTALPEMTASIIAARRGQQEMALANLVGSNVFNLLLIMGFCGLVRPVALSPRLAGLDLWVMLGVTAALAPLVYLRGNITRLAGGVLIGVYLLYTSLFVFR